MVRRIHIDQRGQQPGLPPAPRTHKEVHACRAAHHAQTKNALDRARIAKVQKVQQQFSEKMAQGRIDVKKGIAKAKSKVRAPARPPNTIGHQPVILKEEIDMVAGIVRSPEVAGEREGGNGEPTQQQRQPEKPVAPPRHRGRGRNQRWHGWRGLRAWAGQITHHAKSTCRQCRHQPAVVRHRASHRNHRNNAHRLRAAA